MEEQPTQGDRQKPSFYLRAHTSTILAQAELALDGEFGDLTEEQSKALTQIQSQCYELEGVATRELTPGRTVDSVPSEGVPEQTHRVVVLTASEYLTDLADERVGDSCIEFDTVETVEDVLSTLREDSHGDHDGTEVCVLVDTVLTSETGIEAAGRIHDMLVSPPTTAFVSVYSNGGPPFLGLSATLSPSISTADFEAVLETFCEPDATLAGYVTTLPDTELGERLATADETTVTDSQPEVTPAEESSADAVCLDPETYRRLDATALSALRGVTSGHSRPLFLVTSTAADPYDRTWIPTLGGQQFLDRPLDVVSLGARLLGQQSEADSGLDTSQP